MSKFEIMRHPSDYIGHLQMLNRAKKQKESEESKHKEELVKKENNFHIFLNGANDSRVKEHRKREEHEKSKSPACTKSRVNYAQIHRKKWGKPDIPVLEDPRTRSNWAPNPKVVIRNGSRRSMYHRTGLKNAGNCMARPSSSKTMDAHELVQRIDKLEQKHRDKLLEMLEQFESESLSN